MGATLSVVLGGFINPSLPPPAFQAGTRRSFVPPARHVVELVLTRAARADMSSSPLNQLLNLFSGFGGWEGSKDDSIGWLKLDAICARSV